MFIPSNIKLVAIDDKTVGLSEFLHIIKPSLLVHVVTVGPVRKAEAGQQGHDLCSFSI